MTAEHHAAHHHTGNRRVDLILALSAMFVSIVSLGVAVHHGHAMDRLVAANSWPFLMYGTDNQDQQGNWRIALKVDNEGIGPARVQSFQVWWQNQPVSSADDLLAHCCEPSAGEHGSSAPVHRSVGLVAPTVLRAGDTRTFLSLERTDDNAEVWRRLNAARTQITMRACYCSVFDECWVADLRQTEAQRVKSCPTPKVSFKVP